MPPQLAVLSACDTNVGIRRAGQASNPSSPRSSWTSLPEPARPQLPHTVDLLGRATGGLPSTSTTQGDSRSTKRGKPAGFPGFRSVSLTYSQLQTVVAQSVDGWRTPLSSVKGIYVIVDQETGLQYVGSATGEDGLWGRWQAYAKWGHGGNRELRALLKENGTDYVENFRFTVLEVADLYATEEAVVERESYWKGALGTREHGHNAN